MAVIFPADDRPGVTANVCVNDVAVREYNDDDVEEEDGQVSVTKYIEATSEAPFKLEISFQEHHRTAHGVDIIVFLDGENVFQCVLRHYKLKTTMTCTGWRGWADGSFCTRKFRFTELKIAEDIAPSSIETREALKRAGQISVKLRRITNIRSSTVTSRRWTGTSQEQYYPNAVSEKDLKGKTITHCAKLDLATPSCSPGSLSRDLIDKTPFAQFVFKYRSREALKSLLVIPRTPIPVPLEDRPVESLTHQEALELLRRQKENAARNITIEPVIKREHMSDDDDDDDEIFITSSKRAKSCSTIDQKRVEVIELD
ncbi:hypothetical protein B0J11DRAFT_487707 [Dendryphion nanum]|uniref:DUF7918 domain-containing protein n=1 Tax=Dendryphion nanum TaxID=256645 RepID=A0A9P9DV21_9PLEO|nr:hypothetical protein B0J11DRAFT_487707 [Dendryphion nanum]